MWPSVYFVVILWAAFIIDAIVPGFSLLQYGIYPRNLDGLWGILWSPFLHANLTHLIANTVPLIVLPAIARLAMSHTHILMVMMFGGVGAGVGTWIFGNGGVVVGASGVVFALLGFMIARAYFRPKVLNLVVSLLALASYGGAVLSLLSTVPTVSWAAHFWGFISGLLVACYFRFDLSSAKMGK